MKILAEGDVIDVLLDQHDQIRRALDEVATALGEAKAVAFLELETLLYVHETGEQQVLHPATLEISGASGVADARIAEERGADERLRALRDIDVSRPEFDAAFRGLRDVVLTHLQ